MAKFNVNGIVVNVTRNNKTVALSVLEQSVAATKLIKDLDIKVDGWSLKSNSFPNISIGEKAIFLRGSETGRNDDIATKVFDTVAEAKAVEAVIPKLLALVVTPKYEVKNGDKVTKEAAAWAVRELRNSYARAAQYGESYVIALHRLVTAMRGPDNESDLKKGLTTKIRQAIFGKAIALILKVTDKDEYPTYVTWAKNQAPAKTANAHFQEHANQAWDVLDKSGL